MTFSYQGVEHEYFDDPYNTTRLNERAVELPIAFTFIDAARACCGPDGLEVGNVTGHYRPPAHRVVDRWEHAAAVENLDVFDITDTFDWIVAISTLEHVRWDEPGDREAHAAGAALRHLHRALRPGGRMLVTVPFGWHPFLDSEILAGELGAYQECTFVRDGDGWRCTPQLEHRRYAASTIWAESVWIGEFAA